MKRSRAKERLRDKDLPELPAGDHHDGGGLFLRVEAAGARRWVLRLTIAGKRVNRGLGPYPLITPEMARERAFELRRAARAGKDIARQARSQTFRLVFEKHFAQRQKALKSAKHIWQWRSCIETHAIPVIGERPVADVSHDEIVAILRPIWRETPETAQRTLQRMRIIFDIAISRGLRERANPCLGVAADLGKQGHKVRHHPALPYAEVPGFLAQLKAFKADPVTKLAFEWLILTATRSGETRLVTWDEVQGDRWVIPATRMKAEQEHVVPLSVRCLEILRVAKFDRSNPPAGLIFANRTGKPLSDMTFMQVLRRMGLGERASAHGFRSSFRDWCAEVDRTRNDVAEAALAHKIRDKVEAAYHRTPYLEDRVRLMRRWADFCACANQSAGV